MDLSELDWNFILCGICVLIHTTGQTLWQKITGKDFLGNVWQNRASLNKKLSTSLSFPLKELLLSEPGPSEMVIDLNADS